VIFNPVLDIIYYFLNFIDFLFDFINFCITFEESN